MNASCKPSIASEVHASHKRPYRLALLATFPVATGEAKIGPPRKGTETSVRLILRPAPSVKFKNQNPARGRKLMRMCPISSNIGIDLRTRTPQGDGNRNDSSSTNVFMFDLRTRTPQGDGNSECRFPANIITYHLRTRTPQGDGAYLQPPLPERGRWHT